MKKIYTCSVFALLFFISFAIKAQVVGDPLETLLAVVTPSTTSTSNNGAIDLTVVGGFLPLVIEWSNGATTEDISNLAPGLYTVHVYDRYCGVIYMDVYIAYCNGPALPFTITETHSNTALNSDDGKIDITVSGISSGNYDYYWTKPPPNNVISTNEDISGLLAGTYCVRVIDACGAPAQLCVEITTCQIEYKGSDGITRPCLGLSNGAINLKTSGVQSFLWSTGATTEDISGISAGTYTVTMTDAGGCSVVHTTVVVNNPPNFTIQSNVEAACPPGQGGSGGSIDLTIGGGTGPFTYAWNNGATTQDVFGLTFGIYRVTITDGNGCQAIKLFSVGERNLIIEAGLNHPCTANEPSGAIYLYITDNGFSPYTYEWSTGATTKNISGLLPGNYCITITDADGCEDVSCYTLSTQNSIQIEVVGVENISHCHTNTCNGSVDIKISPSGFYEYEWRRNSNNALVGTSQDISGLCEGYYTVTVINGNGCEKTQTVRVCCCNSTNAQINPPPHPELCDSEQSSDLPPIIITATTAPLSNPPIFYGSITISATGGNGDFYTSWSTGATNVHSLNNLAPGVYSVTVSDGCKSATKAITIYDCGDIDADAIITGIVKPCGGGVANGAIFIRVPDPNGQPISLTRNGFPVPLPTSGYPQTIGITGLPTGNFNFTLKIGLCDINFSKNLTSGTAQTFVEYDNGDCIYNDLCNGVVIGTTTESSYNLYGAGHTSNWGTKCYVPVYCRGNNFIKHKKIDKKWARGYVYLQLISYASIAGQIEPNIYDELLAEFMEEGYTACSDIKYCPGNFRISHFSSTANFDEVNSIVYNSATGCTSVDCGIILGDFEFCGDYGLDDFIYQDGQTTCHIRYENLSVLAYNENILLTNAYYSQNENQLKTLIGNHGSDPEALCTFVSYCNDDFSILSQNNPSCGTFQWDLGLGFSEIEVVLSDGTDAYFGATCDAILDAGLNKYLVYCHNNNSGSILSQHFLNYADFIGFTNPGSNNYANNSTTEGAISNKLITNEHDQEKLVDFAFVTNNGITIPKGLSIAGSSPLYYDYTHRGSNASREEVPYLMNFIDDWDTYQTITTYQTNNTQYIVTYEDTTSEWSSFLNASNNLKISHLSKTSTSIYISGTFKGQLSYFGNNVWNSTEQSIFLIQLSFEGELIGQSIIENIQPDSELLISENKNGEFYIAGQYNNNWIKMNGAQHNFNSSNGFFIIKANNTTVSNTLNIETILFKEIAKTGTFKLLDVSYSGDLSLIAVAATGTGSLSINNQTIHNSQQNHIGILAFNEDQSTAYRFFAPSSNMEASKFDIIFDATANLFCGITFNNNITLGNNILTSSGGNDICIMKMNKYGTVDWTKQYGTSQEENVSLLFYDNSVLYFGGEFSGTQRSRLIGNYHFFNASNSFEKAYISIIQEANTTTSQFASAPDKEALQQRNSMEQLALTVEKLATINPNPFLNSFTINIHDPAVATIKIANSINQVIATKVVASDASIVISMANYANGIYFVEYFNSSGAMLGIQKVVKTE